MRDSQEGAGGSDGFSGVGGLGVRSWSKRGTESHLRVGAEHAPVLTVIGVGGLGVGGTSSGGAGWKSGVKGEESKRQHGGMEWRIEAEGRNGGLGADSSVENLGMGGIAGDGVVGDVERGA